MKHCSAMVAALFASLLAVGICHADRAQTPKDNGGELLMRAPAGERYAERNVQGESILPNGRVVTPSGQLFRVEPHPFGLTLSPDGRWLIAACTAGPQLSILDLANPDAPVQTTLGNGNEKGILDAVFMGLGVARGSDVVYVAGGSDYSIMAFDIVSRARLFRVSCDHTADGIRYEQGYVGDLRLSPDGALLYAVDQSDFRMLVFEIARP